MTDIPLKTNILQAGDGCNRRIMKIRLDKYLADMQIGTRSQVKEYIKKDMKSNGINYDTSKIACQIFDSENNYDPRVEVSSEAYSDGEVIFIDYHMD